MTLKTPLAAIPLPEEDVFADILGGDDVVRYTVNQLRADREAVALEVARDIAATMDRLGNDHCGTTIRARYGVKP